MQSSLRHLQQNVLVKHKLLQFVKASIYIRKIEIRWRLLIGNQTKNGDRKQAQPGTEKHVLHENPNGLPTKAWKKKFMEKKEAYYPLEGNSGSGNNTMRNACLSRLQESEEAKSSYSLSKISHGSPSGVSLRN